VRELRELIGFINELSRNEYGNINVRIACFMVFLFVMSE